MITDRNTLNVFQEFQKRVSLYGDYKRYLDELPAELREVLQETNRLLPLHCSANVIREVYIERLKRIQPNYAVDEYCDKVIDLISQRMAKSGEFESRSPNYGLNKGILILGGIGSGKTLLMKGLIGLLGYFNISLWLIPTYKITENFALEGYQTFTRPLYYESHDLRLTREPLVLDDMGAETIATHYGQVTNVITELLLRRYDEGGLTFGTSNLDQRTIRKFYGERVWSRMKEMFNFIELKGDDRRK